MNTIRPICLMLWAIVGIQLLQLGSIVEAGVLMQNRQAQIQILGQRILAEATSAKISNREYQLSLDTRLSSVETRIASVSAQNKKNREMANKIDREILNETKDEREEREAAAGRRAAHAEAIRKAAAAKPPDGLVKP